MKSVLISIKPKYCELIGNRSKTIEVRKTRPKIETPFKCYIYCTHSGITAKERDRNIYTDFSGKVIGEFVCDGMLGRCESANADIAEQYGCIKREKLFEYANEKKLFGWQISDLKIYDEPKELKEFYNYCTEKDKCSECLYYDMSYDNTYYDAPLDFEPCKTGGRKHLTRPPQSWCYVEGATNNE